MLTEVKIGSKNKEKKGLCGTGVYHFVGKNFSGVTQLFSIKFSKVSSLLSNFEQIKQFE